MKRISTFLLSLLMVPVASGQLPREIVRVDVSVTAPGFAPCTDNIRNRIAPFVDAANRNLPVVKWMKAWESGVGESLSIVVEEKPNTQGIQLALKLRNVSRTTSVYGRTAAFGATPKTADCSDSRIADRVAEVLQTIFKDRTWPLHDLVRHSALPLVKTFQPEPRSAIVLPLVYECFGDSVLKAAPPNVDLQVTKKDGALEQGEIRATLAAALNAIQWRAFEAPPLAVISLKEYSRLGTEVALSEKGGCHD